MGDDLWVLVVTQQLGRITVLMPLGPRSAVVGPSVSKFICDLGRVRSADGGLDSPLKSS